MTTLTRLHISSLRGRRAAGLIAALTMTVAALTACSSAGESDAGDSMSESSPSGGSDGSFTSDDVASEPAAADQGTMDTSSTSYSQSADSSAARAPAIERSIISTGTVSLVSDDVATARQDVQRIIDAKQGTVSEENTETDDEGVATYSRMVIRVPSNSFKDTMQALEKAADLRQSQKSSEDVTTQVIDTDVRVRAQQSSLRRVEELLARADSLKNIIWIESQLTTRQADLDSLKSQQAWLSDQTRESTITVDIQRTSEPEAEKKDDEPAGFVGGLKGGMKALGAFSSALATIVGAMVPFAIVLLVIGGPAWLLVRRSARRRTPKQPVTT